MNEGIQRVIQRLPAGLTTALFAALLLAPNLVLGTLPSHSSPHNHTWATQFADQFRTGILYPRWMPESFDGLGGPTFYFYPPMVFWIDGLLDVVTAGILPVSQRLAIVALLLLWGSGWAMYAWLRAQPVNHRIALLGSLAYQIAPYHLVDHYIRGAIAEFATYAVLPLVMLGLRLTAAARPYGPMLLALAYAALLLSHLPTALLISTIAIPVYVLFLAWPLDRATHPFLLRAAAAGLLGLGLAAIYLLPAVTLQDWISSENLWTGHYVPGLSLLIAHDWTDPEYTMSIVLLASLGCAAVAVGGLGRRAPAKDAVFWALLCLAGVILVAGFVPWFWTLPFLSKVQFPYRLLVVAEFAAITVLCVSPWRESRLATRLCLIVAVGASVVAFGLLASGVRLRVEAALRSEIVRPHDAKEYLPAGYPQHATASYDDLSLDPVKDLPLIDCRPQARSCIVTSGHFGDLAIDIDSQNATTVTLRRFFFPGWHLQPLGLLLTPSKPLHLVSFAAPPGRTTLWLRRRSLPIERWAWAIAGVSAALLLGWAAAIRKLRY